MSKVELLNFAKGEKHKPPFLFAMFDRKKAGEVVIKLPFLLPEGTKTDIIITVRNLKEPEFWKTYNFEPLIEAERRRLMSEMKKGL
jgi:hypothetical protein